MQPIANCASFSRPRTRGTNTLTSLTLHPAGTSPWSSPVRKEGASEAWWEVHRSQLQLPRAQSKERRTMRASEGDRETLQHNLSCGEITCALPYRFIQVCIAFVTSESISLFIPHFLSWSVSNSPCNWWEAAYDFEHFKSTFRTKEVECSLTRFWWPVKEKNREGDGTAFLQDQGMICL